MSQNAHLLAKNDEKTSAKISTKSKPPSEKVLEEMLGESQNSVQKKTPKRRKVEDTRIPNSSTPLVNERIKRKAQQKEDRIELDFEMTEEQKLQEQSLDFGAGVVIKRDGDDDCNIGHGLNSVAKQQEFVRFR